MINKIALLGIGQCGGNVCASGQQGGLITAVMNTSPEDLYADSLKMVKNKLLLGENGGCGKDRNIAKADVKKYHKVIVEFVKEFILDPNPEVEIIYVTFSTSGGTGSGMGPIVIDMLRRFFPQITFAAIGTTPSEDESAIATYNSKTCLEELYRLNVPVLLADNGKMKKLKNPNSRKKLYEIVNDTIIQGFVDIFQERERSNVSNMDIKDKMKLLKTPGITLISTANINVSNLTDEVSLAEVITQSWDESVFVDLDYDRVIKRQGLIFEVSDKVTNLINQNVINKDLGVPLEVFEGIYKAKLNNSRVISILTGLSFPENKIKQIDETLEKVQGLVKKEEKKSSLFSSKVSLFEEEENSSFDGCLFDSAPTSELSGVINLDSLFSNY